MSAHFLTIIVEVVSFIAAVAAIFAGILMLQVTKKFGTGILATGFKNIASGVLFLALGITIDAITTYFMFSYDNIYSALIFLVKAICFVTGTYIIVIASKNMADKLEETTKVSQP
jgi:hypothetical protein